MLITTGTSGSASARNPPLDQPRDPLLCGLVPNGAAHWAPTDYRSSSLDSSLQQATTGARGEPVHEVNQSTEKSRNQERKEKEK